MGRQSEPTTNHFPPRITHPCHHQHPLSLGNPNGGFTCNACANHGDGSAYNCKECSVNIHAVCATLPLSVSHSSHFHQLSLLFLSPYGTGGFRCDVCGVIEGSKCWLYRCGSCGFDAHLACATSKPQVATGVPSRSHQEILFLNQVNNQRNQILQAIMMGYGGGNVNNRLMQPTMGGGNMNNQILQVLMGGGGGNMNNQILQALMGGGGGGNNQLLQAFMGGGGGGGDLIQSLLNGSNGGLDLSSVLGNVGDFGGMMGGGFGGFGF